MISVLTHFVFLKSEIQDFTLCKTEHMCSIFWEYSSKQNKSVLFLRKFPKQNKSVLFMGKIPKTEQKYPIFGKILRTEQNFFVLRRSSAEVLIGLQVLYYGNIHRSYPIHSKRNGTLLYSKDSALCH